LPHAWQRQKLLDVITLASVPIAFERQNGHASGRSWACSEFEGVFICGYQKDATILPRK